MAELEASDYVQSSGRMFWRVASGSAGSEQEALLSKDDVSLEELLDAPYIVEVPPPLSFPIIFFAIRTRQSN